MKEAMSFHLTKTVKFIEEIDYAKFVLFDRIFFVNGLKFSVIFGRTVENYPEIRMELIKGAEILNDPVIIDLGFVSSDCRGKYRFGSKDQLDQLNVKNLKTPKSSTIIVHVAFSFCKVNRAVIVLTIMKRPM